MATSQPKIVDVAPAVAAVEWGDMTFAEIPRFQVEARGRIAAVLREQGAPTHGANVTFSRAPSGDRIAIVPGTMVDRRVVPSGAVTLEAIPAGWAAHLRLEAPHGELPRAWGALMAGVAAEKLRPAGLHWKVYGDPAIPVSDLDTLLA